MQANDDRLSLLSVVAASAIWVLCKGSPEALQERMASIPEGYERTYRGMSERGMRVLALAYRRLSDSEGQRAENMAKRGKGYSREEAESELHFAGFIAFSCRERKDTREVIQNLIHGSHNVAMATGDNVLTALYVADQVALTGQGKRNKGPLVLDEEEAAEENNKKLVWRPARDDDAERLLPCDFTPESLKQLSDWGHDLTMTGYTFRRAVEQVCFLSPLLFSFAWSAAALQSSKPKLCNTRAGSGDVEFHRQSESVRPDVARQ